MFAVFPRAALWPGDVGGINKDTTQLRSRVHGGFGCPMSSEPLSVQGMELDLSSVVWGMAFDSDES